MISAYPGYYIYSGNSYPLYDLWTSATSYYFYDYGLWRLINNSKSSDTNGPVADPTVYRRIPSLCALLACGSLPQLD